MQGPKGTLDHRGKGFQENDLARVLSFVHARHVLLGEKWVAEAESERECGETCKKWS
jgi:hypothetical protein